MRKCKYIGPNHDLKDQVALVIETDTEDTVLLQFDNLTLAPFCFGWHEFKKNEIVYGCDICGEFVKLLGYKDVELCPKCRFTQKIIDFPTTYGQRAPIVF